MSDLINKIRSRGYWWVRIRPHEFGEPDVAHSVLESAVRAAQVSIRGWNFPHFYRDSPLMREGGAIGQEGEWEYYLEAWKFFSSGQFVDLSALWTDWRESATHWRGANWPEGKVLGVGDTIGRFTEILELAARLSASEFGGDRMHVDITLTGLEGRLLWLDGTRGRTPFSVDRRATTDHFEYRRDWARVKLVAGVRTLALDPARRLFGLFGWEPGLELLRGFQEEVCWNRD